MRKSRAIIILICLIYLAAVSVLVGWYVLSGKPQLPENIPQAAARVFCYDAAAKTFSETNRLSDIPAAPSRVPTHLQADLDGDSVAEDYDLAAGKLTVSQNGQVIWQTEDDWRVDDFVLADANNDGQMDLNLSVWKPGSYGSDKPFFVQADDMSVKNHLFVFDLMAGKMKPVWQSSNLTAPNCRILIDDVNGDGQNELVALEGDYADANCTGEDLSVWKWHEWGFLGEWRSEPGNFGSLSIEDLGGSKCVAGF